MILYGVNVPTEPFHVTGGADLLATIAPWQAEVARLSATGLTLSTPRGVYVTERNVDDLVARGYRVILVLAREARDTCPDRVNWIEWYVERYGGRVYAFQIWNEHDGHEGGSSAPIDIPTLLGYVRRARHAINATDRRVQLIGPGSISGQPWAYGELGPVLDLLDAAAAHTYWILGAKLEGWLWNSHPALRDFPLWITEADPRAELLRAANRIAHLQGVVLYCARRWPGWDLAGVDEFNRPLDDDDNPTHRWDVFAGAMEVLVRDEIDKLWAAQRTTDDRVKILEGQQSIQTRCIAAGGQGRYKPGINSLEGNVRRMGPDWASYEATDWPGQVAHPELSNIP